jgi:hypothetical protein
MPSSHDAETLRVKGDSGTAEATSVSDYSLGNCKRCGRPVSEHQSHVMVVPVGHKRIYFHAGCEPLSRPKSDAAVDSMNAAPDRASQPASLQERGTTQPD